QRTLCGSASRGAPPAIEAAHRSARNLDAPGAPQALLRQPDRQGDELQPRAMASAHALPRRWSHLPVEQRRRTCPARHRRRQAQLDVCRLRFRRPACGRHLHPRRDRQAQRRRPARMARRRARPHRRSPDEPHSRTAALELEGREPGAGHGCLSAADVPCGAHRMRTPVRAHDTHNCAGTKPIGMQARRALQIDLRKAVAGGQFEVFYQPLINLRENFVRCFVALLRWNHPARGLVTPADFIPLAEETGLIVPIGEWALRQFCAEAAKWPAGIKVAVNLSPVQFRDGGLVATVEAAIAAAGIAADRLELEITEAVLLENSEASLAALHQLRALGVGIAMDDFGTGYSSLSYLRSFPFDKIKIDRSFIRGLDGSKDSVAIIRAISGLGADLGLITTAEGVETGQQLELVRALGCTEVQGYLIGRPQPACEVPCLLRRLGAEGVVSPQNCASASSPAPPPR